MLHITQRQIEAMAVPLMKRLEPRCLAYLRKSAPEKYDGAPSDELRSAIARSIQEAQHFDFKHDTSILEFVRICIVRQTNYQTLMAAPKTGDVLRKSELNEVEQLYLVDKILRRP